MESWALSFLIGWSLFTACFFVVGGIKLYKFLKKKKRPHLRLIQGGKSEEGPYGNLPNKK